jgi:hypothetical protein
LEAFGRGRSALLAKAAVSSTWMPFPKSANSKKLAKITPADADLPPVLREGQSVSVLGEGRLAGIVVPLPQLIGGELVAARFPVLRQKLANAQNSCCNIRHNRI